MLKISAVFAAVAAAALWWRGRGSDSNGGGQDGVLDAAGVRRLYDRLAPLYDVLASPYELIDGRRLAKQAINELRLSPGDTVVDLGTGTGWALPQLANAVGPTGRVIGVDISPEMLERARRRVEERDNVELIEADISDYQPPPDARAVYSAFAIEMLPAYDEVIERLSGSLPAGGRIAVSGLRNPERWPEWLVRTGAALNRPFSVTEDYRDHRPWEAIRRHTNDAAYRDAIGGVIYFAAGTARPTTNSDDEQPLADAAADPGADPARRTESEAKS